MNESGKRKSFIVISVILSVLLFLITVVYGIFLMLNPKSISDIIVQTDYKSLFGESIPVEDNIREMLPFMEIDSAGINSDSFSSFLKRENVRGELVDMLKTYNDALSDGNLDYYLTPDEFSSIIKSVSPDIQNTFSVTPIDDDIEDIPEELFKLLSIGSLSEQTQVSSTIPYILLSVKTHITVLLLFFLAVANIIIITKKEITQTLRYTGIPVILSGVLFISISLVIRINPGMGSFSEAVSYLGGMSSIMLKNGIIYLIIGVAAIAASLVINHLNKKKRDEQGTEKAVPGSKKRIWLLCTLAVNILIPAICILNVYLLVRDIPQIPERPYFVEIKNTTYSTSITVLNLPFENITNEQLEPLKYMLDLKRLNLENNHISDISVLKDLVAMTELSLSNNKISDISALADMNEMTNLSLSNNQISDISALVNMNKMTVLSLSSNRISDISALADMNELTVLSLSNNQISDVTPLKNMSQMTALSLDNNRLKSISALSRMTEIETITLNDNQLTDISSLSSMKKLTELPLYNNMVEDLTSLAELTELERLYLSNNKIADISPLSGPGKLTRIYLDNNMVSDLSPLSNMHKLAILSLNNNQISTLEPLSKLYYMTELYADNNQIDDLYPINRMMILRILSLNNNDISLFMHLNYMEELRELSLADNQISGSIADAKFLKELQILDLSGNNIDDISGLIIDEDGLGPVKLGSVK